MYNDMHPTLLRIQTSKMEEVCSCHDFKKAGLIQVDSLRTIMLFQPDCYYAFKFIGHEMMKNAERHNTLAPEQFGSCKRHLDL